MFSWRRSTGVSPQEQAKELQDRLQNLYDAYDGCIEPDNLTKLQAAITKLEGELADVKVLLPPESPTALELWGQLEKLSQEFDDGRQRIKELKRLRQAMEKEKMFLEMNISTLRENNEQMKKETAFLYEENLVLLGHFADEWNKHDMAVRSFEGCVERSFECFSDDQSGELSPEDSDDGTETVRSFEQLGFKRSYDCSSILSGRLSPEGRDELGRD